MGVDINQLLTELPAQLNIPLLIALMALGYMIKHVPALSKVSNNLIPIILPVGAILVALLTGDTSSVNGIIASMINGLINAAMAVYLHSTGKNIFEFINANKIKSIIESVVDDEDKNEKTE